MSSDRPPDWGLVGHGWAVRRLAQSIASGQIAQSHLLVGPPSVGKATLARAFAGALLAEGARDQARARALAAGLKHPDLSWIEPHHGAIKVETVRELLAALMLSPVESRYRVAVIVDVHLATDSSQNAILKTLEEPNPSVILCLSAPNADRVLATIVSRCQVLNLRPVSARQIETALLERGAAPDTARLVAHLARGRVGWALSAMAGDELLARRKEHLDGLVSALAGSSARRLPYAEALARHELDSVLDILGHWLLFWRDVASLSGASGAPRVDPILNLDYAEPIARLSRALTPGAAVGAMRRVSDTIKALQQNASPRLALEALLLRLPGPI